MNTHIPLVVDEDARAFVGELLAGVTFRACDLPIRQLRLSIGQSGFTPYQPLFKVSGEMLVAHRDPPHGPRPVLFERFWEVSTPREDLRWYVLQCVRRSIAELLAHEVDECLEQHGKRVVEAHPELTISQHSGMVRL